MHKLLTILFVVLLASAAEAKPNIVVILSDDQDAASVQNMPKLIDLIAQNGLTFTNAFAQFSLCAPSRVTWLTGQEAHNHGVLSNGEGPEFQPQEANALPIWLKAAGYRTALIGKYLNGYDQPQFNTMVPPGWDTWQATAKGDYFDWQMNENGTLVSYGSNAADYSTDVIAKKADDFIASSTQPFFLFVTPHGPHAPNEPAPRHVGKFANEPFPQTPAFNETDMSDKPDYMQSLAPVSTKHATNKWRSQLEQLQSVDDLVEGIINELKEKGELANTVVIFSSDNGFCNGEHRSIGKHLGYECSIRIPLVMSGPGIGSGKRSQLVTNVDLTATIVDLAGAQAGRACDGKSIRPLFTDVHEPWRSAFFFEGWAVKPKTGPKIALSGVRTEKRKFIIADQPGATEELYDLEKDPNELVNQVKNPNYANDLTLLRAKAGELKNCKGGNCWVP